MTRRIDRRRFGLLLSATLSQGCSDTSESSVSTKFYGTFDTEDAIGWMGGNGISYRGLTSPSTIKSLTIPFLPQDQMSLGLFPTILESGKLIATKWERGFKLFRRNTPVMSVECEGQVDSICTLGVSKTVLCLYRIENEGRVGYFDIETGKNLRIVNIPNLNYWCRISASKEYICISSHLDTCLLSVKSGRELGRFPLGYAEINRMGSHLAGATESKAISVTEIKTGRAVLSSQGSGAWAFWHPILPFVTYCKLNRFGWVNSIYLEHLPDGRRLIFDPIIPYKPSIGSWLRLDNFGPQPHER